MERYPYIDFTSTGFAVPRRQQVDLAGFADDARREPFGEPGHHLLGTVNGGYAEELRCAALATAELHREDYTLNWRSMLARGIAVVGPTVQAGAGHPGDVPHPRHPDAAEVTRRMR